jgi:hypothetical protein
MEVGEPGSADAAKINLAQCMTGLYATWKKRRRPGRPSLELQTTQS